MNSLTVLWVSSQGPRPAMRLLCTALRGQDGTGVWALALARQGRSERPGGPGGWLRTWGLSYYSEGWMVTKLKAIEFFSALSSCRELAPKTQGYS
eukprot:scaffold8100_cov61-Phaeocystis_antarctica.AAC.1